MVKTRFVSGWLVAMHTYLYCFRLSLSHCRTKSQTYSVSPADSHVIRSVSQAGSRRPVVSYVWLACDT